MRIPIERNGGVPIYRQIEQYFREGIASGALPAETRLPASRSLAQDLGVSRITVEAAYAELAAKGLVSTRQGSGTFILPPFPQVADSLVARADSWPLWQSKLPPGRTDFGQVSERLLHASGHPQPISFADGGGASGNFPAEEFRKLLQQVMRSDGADAFAYGDDRGLPALRSTIAQVLTSQGLPTSAEDVLVTSGSQQAIALTISLLLKPGDSILVEAPTYGRALDLFRSHGLEPQSIPVDKDGMRVDLLEQLLQQYHPKLIYTIPNFQNPSGTCMSGRRRRQLLALADRYNVPILEDDFVGDLRYDGSAQPALRAMDQRGSVVYVSTFSKMLMPGLRVGFLVASGPVYAALLKQKHLHDLATSALLQRAVQAYVTVGRYQAHLRHSRQIYRRRRDSMLDSIRRYLPAEVTYQAPLGGLFIWLGLPLGLSARRLLSVACELGVAFVPGSDFYDRSDDGDGFLRLNFTTHSPAVIEEGMRRLGQAMGRM